jgi:hypothetical protein
MHVKNQDKSGVVTELPPPPAPTSRDANPWPMPDQASQRSSPNRLGVRRAGKNVLGKWPVAKPGAAPPAMPERRKPFALIPVLIVAGFLGFAINAARDAAAEGNLAAAIVPLLIAGFVAVGYLRGLRSSKQRKSGRP